MKRRNVLPALLLCAILVVRVIAATTLGPAEAATFTADEPSRTCTLRMQGLVMPGDVEAFKTALKSVPTSEDAALCLDSVGGSFNEALAIVKEIQGLDRGVRTVIENGAGCYSACALIFMAGHRSGPEHRVARWVHPLGKLGFHAPFIKPKAGTYDAAVLARAHREALRAIERLLETGGNRLFPDGLVIAMLLQGPSSFLTLETLSQARQWNIDIFDFEPPLPLSQAKLERACINDFGFRERWDKESTLPTTASDKPLRPPQHLIVHFGSYGDEAAFTCHAALTWDRKRLAIDIHLDENEGTTQADFNRFLTKIDAAKDPWSATNTPLWHVLPPDTKLVELAKK